MCGSANWEVLMAGVILRRMSQAKALEVLRQGGIERDKTVAELLTCSQVQQLLDRWKSDFEETVLYNRKPCGARG